jgi:ERCC4-type nuclease
MLIIDDREPLDFAEALAKNCTIPIDFQHLKTGDYVCEDVVIERKTWPDFASSLVDRRMFKQFDRLTKCPHPYILISGTKKDLQSKINPHSMLGAMAYLAAHGVTIIKLDSLEELAYLMLKIFEQHGKLRLANGSFKYP